MEVRTKALITFLLVGGFIGVYTLTGQNTGLFKGELIKRDAAVQLPDLSADLVIVAPEQTDLPAGQADADISVKVTITNNGPGAIDGKKPFKYNVYLNEIEVFSNTDSYTTMASGDSFSFNYPISRSIYQYAAAGNAKVVVDTDNAIEEADENNNEKTVDYSL